MTAVLISRHLFDRLTAAHLATVEADAEFVYAVVGGMSLAAMGGQS